MFIFKELIIELPAMMNTKVLLYWNLSIASTFERGSYSKTTSRCLSIELYGIQAYRYFFIAYDTSNHSDKPVILKVLFAFSRLFFSSWFKK